LLGKSARNRRDFQKGKSRLAFMKIMKGLSLIMMDFLRVGHFRRFAVRYRQATMTLLSRPTPDVAYSRRTISPKAATRCGLRCQPGRAYQRAGNPWATMAKCPGDKGYIFPDFSRAFKHQAFPIF
jgi:hypothetical protein